MSDFDFCRGRFYPLFRCGAVVIALGAANGCMLRWGEASIASVTPTVGMVVTYPVSTNVHIHEVVPPVSPP